MKRIRRFLRKLPVVRDLVRPEKYASVLQHAGDFRSADYWENRYRRGRNSGVGSYNRLARFKADTVNHFVAQHDVRSVIEFGCGDGSQLQLANYRTYLGVDVSKTVLASTQAKFGGDSTKSFLHANDVTPDHRADLCLSLDVLYHLVEDAVYERHMEQLFDHSDRYVIIYSSNKELQTDAVHVRHRRFTDWVERQRPDFEQIGFMKNRFPEDPADPEVTSFADFYFFERSSSPAKH